MRQAVIESFNPSNLRGTLLTGDTKLLFAFSYRQGQNMMIVHGHSEPQFTGRHKQPNGFTLKVPVVGDRVLFEESDQHSVQRWGYLAHYEMLAARSRPEAA